MVDDVRSLLEVYRRTGKVRGALYLSMIIQKWMTTLITD